MSWLRSFLGVVVVLVSGCTKDNPRACGPGDPCTDPAFPFCDIDGVVGGLPGDCLAVDCTPGMFEACSAEQALQCNATGDNYNTVACERGCDPASEGCRLCGPGETACTNDIQATCDAVGTVTELLPCPLGCFAGEPRCTDVDPSNGLAAYLAMSETAPDLDLVDGAIINSMDGTIANGASIITPPSTLLPALGDSPPLRVFMADHVTLRNTAFAQPPTQAETPAVAIVANSAVMILGRIDLTPGPSRVPPGSFLNGPCTGDFGQSTSGPDGQTYLAGSGGGGSSTAGGAGGDITGEALAGAGGAAYPNPDLEPLRGGCASGDASGGGALQIVSRQRIEFADATSIDAAGSGGARDFDVYGGGGSGGGILLEAPIVVLGSGVALTANGGGGAAGELGTNGTTGQSTTSPAPGGVCPGGTGTICTDGGTGGSAEAPPGEGVEATANTGTGVAQGTGAGGGAAGYIRINTADGVFMMTNAVLSPLPTTAQLRTH